MLSHYYLTYGVALLAGGLAPSACRSGAGHVSGAEGVDVVVVLVLVVVAVVVIVRLVGVVVVVHYQLPLTRRLVSI